MALTNRKTTRMAVAAAGGDANGSSNSSNSSSSSSPSGGGNPAYWSSVEEDDFEWEEWNPKHGSFIHHMVAGSIAGIAEHTVMFPVDTIKTHVQCERCSMTKCAQTEVR